MGIAALSISQAPSRLKQLFKEADEHGDANGAISVEELQGFRQDNPELEQVIGAQATQAVETIATSMLTGMLAPRKVDPSVSAFASKFTTRQSIEDYVKKQPGVARLMGEEAVAEAEDVVEIRQLRSTLPHYFEGLEPSRKARLAGIVDSALRNGGNDGDAIVRLLAHAAAENNLTTSDIGSLGLLLEATNVPRATLASIIGNVSVDTPDWDSDASLRAAAQGQSPFVREMATREARHLINAQEVRALLRTVEQTAKAAGVELDKTIPTMLDGRLYVLTNAIEDAAERAAAASNNDIVDAAKYRSRPDPIFAQAELRHALTHLPVDVARTRAVSFLEALNDAELLRLDSGTIYQLLAAAGGQQVKQALPTFRQWSETPRTRVYGQVDVRHEACASWQQSLAWLHDSVACWPAATPPFLARLQRLQLLGVEPGATNVYMTNLNGHRQAHE